MASSSTSTATSHPTPSSSTSSSTTSSTYVAPITTTAAPTTTTAIPTSSSAPASPASSSWRTTDLALTTIYTPPASCKDRLFTLSTSSGSLVVAGQQVQPWPDCYPPDFDERNYVSYIYSPGVCPKSWTINHAYTSQGNPSVMIQVCCTAGYGPINDYYCASWLPPYAPVVVNPTQTTSYSISILAFDYQIPVAWASDQLNLFTPPSAPLITAAAARSTTYNGLTSTTSISRISRHHTSTSSPAAAATKSTSSLTTGDKIGIGVGVGIGGLLVIMAAVVLLLWRRKRSQRVRSMAEVSSYSDNAYSRGYMGSPNSGYYDKTDSQFNSPRM